MWQPVDSDDHTNDSLDDDHDHLGQDATGSTRAAGNDASVTVDDVFGSGGTSKLHSHHGRGRVL